jgi:hypothetical protein
MEGTSSMTRLDWDAANARTKMAANGISSSYVEGDNGEGLGKSLDFISQELIAIRDRYRAEVVKYVDNHFLFFKVYQVPTFEEMQTLIVSSWKKATPIEKQQFLVRSQTILRHTYSNYDVMLKTFPTKDASNRFQYLVKKHLRLLSNANYVPAWQKQWESMKATQAIALHQNGIFCQVAARRYDNG